MANKVSEKARGAYFFLEDRYYALLDKINQHVPIYNVIDPIDKVIPSFVLFSALLLLLVVIFIFLSIPQLSLSTTFKVVDEDSSALKGVKTSVSIMDEMVELETDGFGEAKLP